MDLSEIVKHLRDEAESHKQQAGQADTDRLDHLRKAAELELHARQLEAVGNEAGSPAAEAVVATLPDEATEGTRLQG